jgi:Ca2+-binding EF-hand superfamily protein
MKHHRFVVSTVASVLSISLLALITPSLDAARTISAIMVDDAQDVLYLVDKRPYRIRLHLRLNGEPIRRCWVDFMARLFKFVDVNDDKVLNKSEVVRMPSPSMIKNVVEGQLGTHTAVRFLELDANQDAKVTFAEFIAYFQKSGCGPIQTSTDRDRGASPAQLTGALFKHLDPKGTGKLTELSIRSAPEKLLSLDDNEDDLISTEELLPGSRFGFPPPDNAGKEKPAPMLALVNRDDPPAKQSESLFARYDKNKNGKLSRDEIHFGDADFTSLDRDKDNALDAIELANWLARECDLELELPLREPRKPLDLLDQPQYSADGHEDRPIRVVRSDACFAPLLDPLNGKDTGGATFCCAGSFLAVEKDRSSQWALGRRRFEFLQKYHAAQRGQTFVSKKAAMRNRDIGGLFPCLDRNSDGKVTEEEFDCFFDLILDVNNSFGVIILSERGHCLFELLDTNRDKHLGIRELRDAWKALSVWDVDKNGAIEKGESPRLLQITASCGRPARFDNFAASLASADLDRRKGPLWFRQMDKNGDGDVSRREWLGSEQVFVQIDRDGDGLIDVQEATREDLRFRDGPGSR